MEFGGGPVIVNFISAVPYVNQITFSAYAESEQKEIELWKNKEEGAQDWSSHFQGVVNEVEQIAGDDAWREREELLRKRITNIVIPCDIHCDDPLLVNKQEPFKIISTMQSLPGVGLLNISRVQRSCEKACGFIETRRFSIHDHS